MKLQKTKKIATKVTMKIAIVLALVFVVLTLIIQGSIRRDLVAREQEKLTLLATTNANIAREFMESMANKQSVLISTISNLEGVEDLQKEEMLKRIITQTKAEESTALSLFYVAEPNTFIENSPNGYTIYATEAGTKSETDMYKFVNKDIYEQVKKDKKMTVADPFSKTIDGNEYMVVTVVQPIINERNEFIGLVGSNINTELLNNADYNHGEFSTFAMQIICGHQTVITDSKSPESIGKPYVSVSDSTNSQKILDAAKMDEPFTFVDTSTDGEKYYKSYVPFYIRGSSVVWLSGTNITKAEFDIQIFKQIALIIVALVVSLLVLALFSYFIIKQSLRPIHTLNESIKELSKGNLRYKLDYHSNDEFGSLADSLRESASTLYSYVTDIDRAMHQMAIGNFNLGASQPFIGDFENIETSISKFLEQISSTLLQVRISAQQVSAGSMQVSDGAQALAQSATEQASSVELLSSEIASVTEQIKNTADNAAGVSQLTVAVGEKLSGSNKHMSEMSTAIADINSSSVEIGKIIKVIEDIAFQTNILALNAAVEAARAGVAGKGFAVVADEVRNLATKSSEAAKQTGVLIEDSVKTVKKGVEIAEATAASLVEVVTGAQEITKLISEISQASSTQKQSISQITLGIDQISAVVQTNSATSEESAAASEELSSQAEVMKSLVSNFQLKEG